MIDFKKALEDFQTKQGYCHWRPPPRRQGTLIGWVGDDKASSVRHLDWEIRKDYPDDRTLFSITEGGVTGSEAWYVIDLIYFGLFDDSRLEWFYACAGGGGWQELKIKTTRVQAIVKEYLTAYTTEIQAEINESNRNYRHIPDVLKN